MRLLGAVSKNIFKVAVACESTGYLVDEVKKEDVSFFPISMSNSPSISSFVRCIRVLNTFAPDILHTHGGTAGVYGRAASVLSRTPHTVHTYHGIHYLHFERKAVRFVYTSIDRLLLLVTDRIICVAQMDFDDGCRAGIVNPKKSHVITNGIDVEYFHREALKASEEVTREKKGKEVVIGTIGRLHHQKGYEYFIEAAAIVLREYPNAIFHIVGDGSLRSSLERKCRALGIDGIGADGCFCLSLIMGGVSNCSLGSDGSTEANRCVQGQRSYGNC